MLLVVSCSLIKTPAQLAIKAAIEATLNGAKQSFEKGDSKAALAAAKDLPAKIKDLAAAIEARKAELDRTPRRATQADSQHQKYRVTGHRRAGAR